MNGQFFPGILNSHVNNFQTRNIRKANCTTVYHKLRKEGARWSFFFSFFFSDEEFLREGRGKEKQEGFWRGRRRGADFNFNL